MWNVVRLALLVVVTGASLGGLFARDAEALSCPADCHSCSPYGLWCNDLATGQSFFCDDFCENCVLVTEAGSLPDVNCKT
jgi:hypothetical protein